MGVRPGCRQRDLGKLVPGDVSRRHHRSVRIGSMVQVVPYVLQAGSCLPEKGGAGERFAPQSAAPRRQPGNLRRRSPTAAPFLIPPSTVDPGDHKAMPTFVYMTSCDGCGHCVDICPSDIMHIETTYRRAYNIEPNMCWECYSCVK